MKVMLYVVPEETRHRGCFVEPLGSQVGTEQAVGKDACLGKAIAATADFKEDPAIAVMSEKVVFCNEFIWDVGELDADIFRIRHGHVQEIEVLEIKLRRSLTSLSDAVLVPTLLE